MVDFQMFRPLLRADGIR